jgi:copper(I)-binding protein
VTRRLLVLAALVVLAAAGCVHYPTVADTGGVRLQPERGRAVREGDTAAFYVELRSTGKFGDVLTGVLSPVARQAQLVNGAGAPIAALEIPGTMTVNFVPGGPHAILSDFTRPLVPGETIIVTLMFQKYGALGVVTVVE